ncbi:hypothetical protein CBS101457_001092 [Exobasidium rhododendri]|nr:hypothetical protein CBS101457_001092 [Exobasidium rhododendri]
MSSFNTIDLTETERSKFAADDCAFLDNIDIGCLNGTDNMDTAAKATINGTMLETDNFSAWYQEMHALFQGTGEERALDMLEGKARASIEAYQRYFGTKCRPDHLGGPDSKPKGPFLLSATRAQLRRKKEEQHIRIMIFNTLSRKVKDLFNHLRASPLPVIWKAIEDRYRSSARDAARVLDYQLSAYHPNGKTVTAVADDLCQLFAEHLASADSEIPKDKKTNFLLRALEELAESNRPHLKHGVERYREDHTKAETPFDEVFRKARDLDEKEMKSASRKGAPNMFKIEQPQRSQPPIPYKTHNKERYSNNADQMKPDWQRCNHCGELGHFVRDCHSRRAGQKATTRFDAEGNLVTKDNIIIRHHYQNRLPPNRQRPSAPYQQGGPSTPHPGYSTPPHRPALRYVTNDQQDLAQGAYLEHTNSTEIDHPN